MPLPEGRKPLSDFDMIKLLQSIAGQVNSRDQMLSEELRQTASRLEELSKGQSNE